MDDEDSKVRRNLVTSSALVLLLVWLRLPLADVAERLLNTRSSASLQIDAARVWSAVVVVLVYFALRFVFSDSFEKAGETIRVASIKARARVIEVVVRWELWLFNWFEKDSPVFHPDLAELLEAETTEMQQELDRHPSGTVVGVRLMKATILLGEFQDGTEQWTGGVGVEFEWKTDKNGLTSSSGSTVRWLIRGYRRFLVMIVAFLRVVLLSRVGISILYPLVMFTGALVTSLVMLWRVL